MTNANRRIIEKVLEYLLRRRSPGMVVMRISLLLLGVAALKTYSGQLLYGDPNRFFGLQINSLDFLPSWANDWLLMLAIAGFPVGLVLLCLEHAHDRKLESKRKNIIVEIRGLHSSPDTSPTAKALSLPRGRTDPLLIDFRPSREEDPVDPDLVLDKLDGMKRALEGLWKGGAREDVTLAVGGMAATPSLFLAGMLLDDESNIVVYDWDRQQGRWRLTDDFDDGRRMLPVTFDAVPVGAREVVLAVSASYAVDEDALRRRFQHKIPVVHLRVDQPRVDQFWSAEKQQACVVAFLDTVQRLDAAGVKRIHLVLATPASLAIRMGRAYDRRLMPELLAHQYERTTHQGYPWAFRMPTHGQQASVVRFRGDVESPFEAAAT